MRSFWQWLGKLFGSVFGNSIEKKDRAIQELINRPIVDLLNTPDMKERVKERALELGEKYKVPVVILDNMDDVRAMENIPSNVLEELESGEFVNGFMIPGDATHTVYIYTPFNTSLKDLEKTFTHEAFGHISMREFFESNGRNYDEFLGEMYERMSAEDKRMIQNRIGKGFATMSKEDKKKNIAVEMDEYIAENREHWHRNPIYNLAYDLFGNFLKKHGIWAEFSKKDFAKMYSQATDAFMSNEKKAERTSQIAAANEQQQQTVGVRYSKKGILSSQENSVSLQGKKKYGKASKSAIQEWEQEKKKMLRLFGIEELYINDKAEYAKVSQAIESWHSGMYVGEPTIFAIEVDGYQYDYIYLSSNEYVITNKQQIISIYENFESDPISQRTDELPESNKQRLSDMYEYDDVHRGRPENTASNDRLDSQVLRGDSNQAKSRLSQAESTSTQISEGGNNVKFSVEETDAEYLAAVERGDMETAQRMVDEAAARAGYTVQGYHGTSNTFTVFDRTQSRPTIDIQGNFFSPYREEAEGYGNNVGKYYLRLDNPADERTALDALNMFRGQNDAGIKAREYLESQGYDSVNNSDEEFIAFNAEQIKSADPVTYDDNGKVIPLSKRFDTTEVDTRYRISGSRITGDTKRELSLDKRQKRYEEWVDRTYSVRLMQDDMINYLRSNGFFNDLDKREMNELLDSVDVATVIENIDSAVEFEFNQYRQTLGKDLNDAVAELSRDIKNAGIVYIGKDGKRMDSIQILKLYMIAKDNLEREQSIENDYILPTRGLEAFIDETNTTWEGFVDEFESKISDADIQNLWDKVREVREYSLKKLLNNGMITSEQYNNYMSLMFYVPERGFMDDDLRSEYEERSLFGRNKKRGIDNKATIKAKGGESLAGDVIESLHLIAADAINKSAQNAMRQKMFDILTNQDLEGWREQLDVPTPKRMELVYDSTKDKFVYTEEGITPEEQRQTNKVLLERRTKLKLLTADRNQVLRDLVIAKRNGVEDVVAAKEQRLGELDVQIASLNELLYEVGEDNKKKSNQVDVYINGYKHQMHMPNANIADTINGIMYDTGNGLKAFQSFTRNFANLMTTYNHTFAITNSARDVARISAAGMTEYGLKFEGYFLANIANPVINHILFGFIATGKVDESTNYGKMLKEFFQSGAHTGFTTLTRMEDLRKEIQKLSVESQRGVFKKIGKAVEKFTIGKDSYIAKSAAAINAMAEYWTRFAAYKAVRDLGYSSLEASKAAKNLSVNFNRRGKGSLLLSLATAIVPFTNAAIQGASGYIRHFGGNEYKSKAGAFTRAFTFMTLIPMGLGYLSYLMNPDDDENEYFVPQYERETYFTLPGGIRFAYDEQLGVFSAVGSNIAKLDRGYMTTDEFWSSTINLLVRRLVPAPEVMTKPLTTLIDNLVFDYDESFLEDLGSLLTFAFGNNLTSIANNKTFYGGKLRTDIKGFAEYNSDTTSPLLYQDLAKMWAELCGLDVEAGGTIVKDDDTAIGVRKAKSSENVNPREFETLFSYVPNTITDVFETGYAIANWKDFWNGENIGCENKSVFRNKIKRRYKEDLRKV